MKFIFGIRLDLYAFMCGGLCCAKIDQIYFMDQNDKNIKMWVN